MQLPLFDLSTIPRRSKSARYLHGYSQHIIDQLLQWDAWFGVGLPYHMAEIPPALLRPTQRTIEPKTVAYYKNTGRLKDTNGLYPSVVHAYGCYWITNGHHRCMANIDQPRIRARVYEFESIMQNAVIERMGVSTRAA